MDSIHTHRQGLGTGEGCQRSLEGMSWVILFYLITWTDWLLSCYIIKDSNDIQQLFSLEQLPTLWRTLPALEELQTEWEKKRDSARFALYKNAIKDGLGKLQKYYSRMDSKPSFVLALGLFLLSKYYQLIFYLKAVLHPYYKLDYIKLKWGGAKEQEEERERGNLDAKNWQYEARNILENTVSIQLHSIRRRPDLKLEHTQIENYYQQRPGRNPSGTTSSTAEKEGTATVLSEYDRYRQTLVNDDNEGWTSDFWRYLKDRPADVKKDTDIVHWWRVHSLFNQNFCFYY